MFCNKKGEWSILRTVILLLVVGTLLLIFSNTLREGGARGADIAACRNWAVIQNAVKDPVLGVKFKDITIPCVTFKDKLEGNKYEVYDQIAKGMHNTWNMYGQGKIDFYSDWDWGTKNTYCLIGDEITIDKKKLKTNQINIDEFEEFLNNNYPPNSEQTYAVYFTGVENTKIDFGSGDINLDKNNKIYVLFTVKKTGLWGLSKTIKMDILGCVTGGTLGGAIGTFAMPVPLIGTIIGAGKGCLFGMVASEGIHIATLAGQSQELHPGLFLISEKNTQSLEKKCDGGIYYNPK